jgi:hypothetical protein
MFRQSTVPADASYVPGHSARLLRLQLLDQQQKYLQQVPVSYPLLTVKGTVPSFYRDIARYPAIFLIDRNGRLQPTPGLDRSFEKLGAAVDALLSSR